MSKARLRQRIEDIIAGVTGEAIDEDFFILVEHLPNLISALSHRFNIDPDSCLIAVWNMDEYQTVDTLLEFFWRHREDFNY